MAVTIRDVAALAGVSPSTVSRTCQNSPSISEDTKRRVRQAAKQLGYAMGGDPAQSPAPRTIGVILPPSAREVYENPFYLEMIRGINQFCNAHQYVSTIVTGRDNDEILAAIGCSSPPARRMRLFCSIPVRAIPSSTIWCRRG